MPATYSDLLRLTKQGDGDNSATWGQVANNQVFELIEDAIAKIETISVTAGSLSLSTANGTADQARAAALNFTGTPVGVVTVTVPSVSKIYYVRNTATQNVILSAGGATVTVFPNRTDVVLVIGSDVRSMFASLPGVTGPVTVAQGGTGQITAPLALNALLPSQASNSGRVLTTNGTDASWGVSSSEVKSQRFDSGVGFTGGVTNTLTLTNTPVAPTSDSLFCFFEAAYQGRTVEYTYNPANGVVSFIEPIPEGVAYVEFTWVSSGTISNVPADGSTTFAKFASGVIATVAEMIAGTASKIISAANLKTYIEGTRSFVRVNTANGVGSTNTAIRRFTTLVANAGTDITYADSATLGASFTINTTGVYSIHYHDQSSSVQYGFGISRNSAQLTTSIVSITAADRLAVSYTANNASPTVASTTLLLTSGDVIRPHNDLVSSNGVAAISQLTITRIN